MNRRSFSRHLLAGAATLGWMPFVPREQLAGAESSPQSTAFKDSDTGRQWLRDWETHILSSEKDRYCDKELGEELGWLVSPFLNGGYYQIDVEAMVDALDHGLVFKKDDLNQWIATNRDFMWNQTLKGASFRRIDGGETDPRWKNSPGVLWNALIPHDKTLRQIFAANHRPASWGGIGSTPWFLSLKA